MGLFKAIGSIVGASKQKKATKRAVAALEAAGNQAIGTYNAAQDAILPTYQPYQDAGTKALGSLSDLVYGAPSTIAASPDYQFRVNEGQRALNATLNARGLSESGAAMKEAIRYGQDMGAAEYDNRYRRLADLVNTGFSANNNAAQVRLGTAGNVAGTQMDIGNARAAGFIRRGDLTAGQWQTAGGLADKFANAAMGAYSGGASLGRSVLAGLGLNRAAPGTSQGSGYQPIQLNLAGSRLGSMFGRG